MDVPVLTLRYNTERPETVSAGGNILVGANKNNILENAEKILNDEEFADKMKMLKILMEKGMQLLKLLMQSKKHIIMVYWILKPLKI